MAATWSVNVQTFEFYGGQDLLFVPNIVQKAIERFFTIYDLPEQVYIQQLSVNLLLLCLWRFCQFHSCSSNCCYVFVLKNKPINAAHLQAARS